MSRIKIMDQALANLIAAGEVIERPASVVKELVENSIDAGATRITIEVERAGSRLIAVTDNGSGMAPDDARTALELHGTSKLTRAEDINTIATMGFRGEALPSIAQVSRFTMQTRESGAEAGTELVAEGGKLLNESPCGTPPGTRISVENLFFNTPARKKFMKSPATEEHHIEEAVTLLALANCSVSFDLMLDGRRSFRLPAGDLRSRMRELFGRSCCDNMLSIHHKEGSLQIDGMIGVPGFTRSSRREQRFFVNSRSVDSPTLSRALREGYGTLAEPGRYPPVVLFVTLPAEDIDVNVHPAKREIRFRSEFMIIRAVAASISKALRTWGAGTPEESAEQDNEPYRVNISNHSVPYPAAPGISVRNLLDGADVTYRPKMEEQPELLPEKPVVEPAAVPRQYVPEGSAPPQAHHSYKPEEAVVPPSVSLLPKPPAPETPAGFWPERIIGIYDDTYLLAAGREGLLLIDQHAAHERIMFEKLLNNWRQPVESINSQGLLIPEMLELPRGLLTLLTRNLDFFQNLGFDFVPAGKFTVIVNALPVNLKISRPVNEFIIDLLNGLLEENYAPGDLEAVARAACHAAVKAHDKLTQEGAENLLKQLRECRQGTLCPHGRPTMITLTLREIEKRFGRR